MISHVAVLEILNQAQPELLKFIQIKGGVGLVFKLGLSNTRFTRDLDLTMPNRQSLLDALPTLFSYSWHGFSIGSSTIRPIYAPPGIPVELAVQRIDLQLKFLETKWLTTRLDITQGESIGTNVTRQILPHQEILLVLERLGLVASSSFNLITAEFQVAQKLQAVSQFGSERGRDLFDIYLLAARKNFDQVLCQRLLTQLATSSTSPPNQREITPTEVLAASYRAAVNGLNAPDFDTALDFCNQLLLFNHEGR